MIHGFRLAPAVLALAVAASPLAATDPASEPPTPQELAARERVRPAVEAIWREVRTPPKPGVEGSPYYFFEVTDALIALGPDVTPFLISEVDLEDAQTYHFAVYALGRIGGPGAEAALRKAARRADDRGGRFGIACKRMAVFGLALLGVPDAIVVMQDGEDVSGTVMIPDLYLMPQVAAMLGPSSGPTLLKRIEAFAADPAETTRLEWALRGIGRAGDPSVVPALLPFLRSESIGVRTQAAEAIGRLGDASVCDKLVPNLAHATNRENQVVALALARLEPAPCVPALIARLETETDIEVRSHLYRAIAAVQGEAALEVLRPYIDSTNPYEPTIILDTIGRIGSRKGLNLVRSSLQSKNNNSVQRALDVLALLGGEGAVDSLMAMTGDSRRPVRLLACRNLTELGVRKAGPKVAANLLEIVAEPVGNLSQRAPVLEYSNALVTLRYTEPIPDLEAAAAKQTDPEIVASLRSCVRRLKLLVDTGDDAAKWAALLSDPQGPVRELAALRLAEIGSPAAVASLDGRLADPALAPAGRAQILRSIGEAKTAGAAAAIERHLADPAFDAFEQSDTRTAAAWAARRLGGERMVRALKESAVRRDGRDYGTLVYWAVADSVGSRETITSLRSRRLRYPQSAFGREDEHLGEILRDLAHGRVPKRFDVPPEKLPTL